MAEVLVQFDTAVPREGVAYVARVCGREVEGGLWEGWIEFDSGEGGAVLRTPRETEQPNRADLEYWATGLTLTYLEGALARALDPQLPDLRPRTVTARAAYERPASSSPDREPAAQTAIPTRAVVDPFEVYSQGEDVLRQELGALDEGHLRNIVRAYHLAGDGDPDPRTVQRASLVDMIVAAVRRRA